MVQLWNIRAQCLIFYIHFRVVLNMNDGFSSGSEGDSSSSSEVDVEPADVSTLQTKNDDVTESDSELALVTPPRTGRMPPSERRHRRLNVTSLEENRTDARQRPLYNLYR